MINPAYAGVYNNFSANIVTRSQWANIDGSPLTNIFSAHSAVADKFGAGILLVNDRLGVSNNTEAQLSFSYKITSPKYTLALGVQGGIVDYRYDYSKLNLAFVDDEGLDMNNQGFVRGNFGAGAFFMTERYYIGLSVPRILNAQVNDGVTTSTRYVPHYYLSTGMIIKTLSDADIMFKPTLLVRYTQKQVSADIGFNALFAGTIWAGAILRDFKAVAITTQIQVKRSFRFGYSFELPTNQLVQNRFSTHEVSLLLELNIFKDHFDIERYF